MNLVLFVPIVLLIYLIKRYRGRRSLPPGPKGYPIIGNIYDIPRVNEWITYKKMSEACNSDVIHLDLLGTDMIILNSRESCKELLEVRSSIYSDRPDFTMLNELVGCKWIISFMRYENPLWKDCRALFHKELDPISRHYPILLDATRSLLCRLATDPDQFIQHLRQHALFLWTKNETQKFYSVAGTIILSTAYGIDVQPANDPYVDISERSLHAIALTGNMGQFLVDIVPIMKYIPSWFPGAGFKRLAKRYRTHATAMPTVTLDFVKRSMVNGMAKSSMASRHMSEMQEGGTWTPYQEEVLSSTLGTMYAAGADTTVSSLGTFILAMVKYPEIQQKAQAAVDKVFGGDRLPDFSDQSSPYLRALVYEVLRWKPVTPLAVAHRVTQDDVYKGYCIPCGALVVGNVWAFLHDQAMYGPDTDDFNPERFLKDGVLDPEVEAPDIGFGFGRRSCPGRHLAEASIWIAVVSMLTCFDFLPAVDDKGRKLVPPGTYSSGLLWHVSLTSCSSDALIIDHSYPDPFKCTIVPRSTQAEDMLKSM